MNIHEYQAKELLAKFGAPIAAGYAAFTVDEAVEAAGRLPGRSMSSSRRSTPVAAARASSRNSARMRRAASASPSAWTRSVRMRPTCSATRW